MAVAAAISRPLRGRGKRTASGSGAQHLRQAQGNTVVEQKPSYTRYYEWDGRDMMVGVRSTEVGWTDNVYRYDGMASRVSTLESIGLTYFDWDGINVIQEKDASNTVTDRQVHGYAPVFSVGDIALMDKAAGSVYVPLADVVGTIWSLTDSNAGLANSYTYDALGAGRSVSEAVSNLYRFGTRRLAPTSDAYYFVARPYAPVSGRFVGAGIASLGGGYRYAGSDPTQATQPISLPGSQCDINGMLADPGEHELTKSEVTIASNTKGQFGAWHIQCTLYFRGDQECCQDPRIVQVVKERLQKYAGPASWVSTKPYHLDIATSELPAYEGTHKNDPIWEYNRPDHLDPVLYPWYHIQGSSPNVWILSWSDDPGFPQPPTHGWPRGLAAGAERLDMWGELCLVCFDQEKCGTVLGCRSWDAVATYANKTMTSQMSRSWKPESEVFKSAAALEIFAKCARLWPAAHDHDSTGSSDGDTVTITIGGT